MLNTGHYGRYFIYSPWRKNTLIAKVQADPVKRISHSEITQSPWGSTIEFNRLIECYNCWFIKRKLSLVDFSRLEFGAGEGSRTNRSINWKIWSFQVITLLIPPKIPPKHRGFKFKQLPLSINQQEARRYQMAGILKSSDTVSIRLITIH